MAVYIEKDDDFSWSKREKFSWQEDDEEEKEYACEEYEYKEEDDEYDDEKGDLDEIK